MPIKYRKYVAKKMINFYEPEEKNTLDNPSEDVKQMASAPPADYMYRTKVKKASKN